ncbi:MAG TPA: hypothetical protein VFJ05_05030 [Nitrososphaeraceae archaeon]|jgi:hypothetical protein|nr:hypothetical protein [Nitrososphaeraceae archaeon]
MAKDSITGQHPIGKDIYTSHIQVRIKMILSIQKILLIVTIVYLVLFFALGSGLFNSIIEGTARSARTFIIPSRSIQTIGETIVTTMILFIGMAGAFLLYKAGNSINPKNQGGLLIAGFATIGIAMLLGFRLVDIKV